MKVSEYDDCDGDSDGDGDGDDGNGDGGDGLNDDDDYYETDILAHVLLYPAVSVVTVARTSRPETQCIKN